MQLEGGRKYAVRVEYQQNGRGGGAELDWIPPAAVLLAEAEKVAKDSDVALVFVGLNGSLEGEGHDRSDINPPEPQENLVKAMIATGKPVVVVLTTGSALAANYAAENAAGLIVAWYGGEEAGTAIAETLAGSNNPAGRLPVTFYKSMKDLPPFEDYSMKGRTYRYFEGQPLYPFGYGLSYSKFAYNNARLSTTTLKAGSDLLVDVDVRNTSAIAGDEVVQVYIEFPKLSGAPLRTLCAFQRVSLQPGQVRHVRLTLTPRDVSLVNEEGTRVVAAGAYKLFIGGGQPGTGAPGMQLALTIQGEQKLPQ